MDLEGAAGVGRLDEVRSFFEEDGRLKAGVTSAQTLSGFQWACEYGHTPVVEFFLQQGVATNELHRGQTGLHWGAYRGHVGIVKLLLRHGAPIQLKDERFDGTPLGWALHGWAYAPEPASNARYHEVVAALVAAGAKVDLKNIPHGKFEADPRMAAALRGELPAD